MVNVLHTTNPLIARHSSGNPNCAKQYLAPVKAYTWQKDSILCSLVMTFAGSRLELITLLATKELKLTVIVAIIIWWQVKTKYVINADKGIDKYF